jgi:hypothetical protein
MTIAIFRKCFKLVVLWGLEPLDYRLNYLAITEVLLLLSVSSFNL